MYSFFFTLDAGCLISAKDQDMSLKQHRFVTLFMSTALKLNPTSHCLITKHFTARCYGTNKSQNSYVGI